MKNPILAFLLSFFPGAGLLYLGKSFRGLVYMFGIFALIGVFFLTAIAGWFGGPALIIVGFGMILYFINIADTALTASRLFSKKNEMAVSENMEKNSTVEQERFFTIVLSFFPGLGHFQLGLMNRGMTILISFVGLAVMIFFVTFLTAKEEFLVFLLILPVIWFYSLFDAMQHLNKRQKGEELVDRSILEDLDMNRQDGKKSKSIAVFLSIFPGAGHLYLGLQRRGIQLMAAFLFSIYILDVLRLGVFLFFIPMIWFYSFFDGLQFSSRYGKEPLEDKPIVSYFIHHRKWLGIGLILVGVYYLTNHIVLPAVAPYFEELVNMNIQYWFDRYFQTTIVCLLLIFGGIKLLLGQKKE